MAPHHKPCLLRSSLVHNKIVDQILVKNFHREQYGSGKQRQSFLVTQCNRIARRRRSEQKESDGH